MCMSQQDDCRAYHTCSECIAHTCKWLSHSKELSACVSYYHHVITFSGSMIVKPGGNCPDPSLPEPSITYFTILGFPIWALILVTLLLVLGFRFMGRRFFLTLKAHLLTQCRSLGSSEAKENNHPAAVKSRPNQKIKEESKLITSKFFERAAPLNGLEKVETLNWQLDTSPKGTLNLEFDDERMTAYLTGGTVKLWDWQYSKETTMSFGIKLKDIKSLQYDEEVIILGTAAGTVHLYDARKFEETWSLRFEDPVGSVKFVESTLIVLTRGFGVNKFWWVDISRPDMKLLNRRLVLALPTFKSFVPKWARCFLRFPKDNSIASVGLLIDSEYCYLYAHSVVSLRYVNSGGRILNERGRACWLLAPAGISTLYVASLVSANRILIAGCKNGTIAMWNTGELNSSRQVPHKTLKGHTGAIRSLCALNGHLLSVDQSGKLFMWSGSDLECNDVDAPVPRILAQNFLNVSCLAGSERWFASSTSDKGIINIWALPDLWLHTG